MRPGRGLELELGDRFLHRDHAGLQEDRGHGDGVPAAHDGVLHLLHDDVAGGCVGVLRRHDEVAARGRISAGFTKHQQAHLVVVLLQPPHLLVDGLARVVGTPPVMTRIGIPEWVSTTLNILVNCIDAALRWSVLDGAPDVADGQTRREKGRRGWRTCCT
jgi:hypothetical protein